MGLKLITPPAVEPITLAEMKKHLNEDSNHNDDLINLYIKAVREHLDARGVLGVALVEQTWDLIIDAFPCHEIEMPFAPLRSVPHIKYDDVEGNEQLLDDTLYTVDTTTGPGWVLPAGSWPATFAGVNAVRIRFVAGWPVDGVVVSIPADIKLAMMMMVATHYRRREDVVVGTISSVLPWQMQSLLQKYVRYLH